MSAPTPYERALAYVDRPENRHRAKGRATIALGVIYPFARYVWLDADPDAGEVIATLYGNTVATIRPDTITFDTCGEFTPSTRTAFDAIIGLLRGQPWSSYAATMATPGSKGGKPGPWSCTIRLGNGGPSVDLTESVPRVTVPAGWFA